LEDSESAGLAARVQVLLCCRLLCCWAALVESSSFKMGHSYSYFNIWAVSTIVTTEEADIETFLQNHETDFRANYKSKPIVEELDNAVDSSPEEVVVSYIIKEDIFNQMLVDQNFTTSDIEILINLFRLEAFVKLMCGMYLSASRLLQRTAFTRSLS